jgi:hypothetical protein
LWKRRIIRKIKLDFKAYPCYNVGVGYFLSGGMSMESINTGISVIDEAPPSIEQGIVLGEPLVDSGLSEGLDRIDQEVERVFKSIAYCQDCGFKSCRC